MPAPVPHSSFVYNIPVILHKEQASKPSSFVNGSITGKRWDVELCLAMLYPGFGMWSLFWNGIAVDDECGLCWDNDADLPLHVPRPRNSIMMMTLCL
jgi:hypothetical protein